LQPLIVSETPLQFGTKGPTASASQGRGYGRHVPMNRSPESWFTWACRHGDLAAKMGFVASMGYLALTMVYATMLNGSIHSLPQASKEAANDLAVNAGLSIGRIVIHGRAHTPEAEIYSALAAQGQSMLGFDTRAAMARLQQVGWIKTVELQRLWPSTLVVRIEERQPAALWQDGAVLKAVDADGAVLGPVAPDTYPRLHRVAGEDAPAAAQELIGALEPYKEIKALLTQAERISGRRWDLVLEGGARVKLPETGLFEALAQLDQLISSQNLPLADLAMRDLRAPAQVALHLKSNAKDARQKVLSSLSAAPRQPGL
jgi:cell division protein FtsQ